MHERSIPSMGRIPTTLQTVFLASNRGKAVHSPPPDGVATKVFVRNWVFPSKRKSSHGKNTSMWKMGGNVEQEKGDILEQGGSIRSSAETISTSNGSESSATSDSPRRNRIIEDKSPGTRSSRSFQKTNSFKNRPQRINSSTCKNNQENANSVMPPQEYLDKLLHARGYSTERFETLKTAYYNKPTPLQIASYDVHLLRVVREHDVDGLRELLAAGLSPNPCNCYGESLIHMVCRRGEVELLKVLLEFGCMVQVADDHGRTPLHDAFWAATPNWEVVELIMKQDIRLFYMADSRGFLPLNFCRKEHYSQWTQFLHKKMDVYWFPRNFLIEGDEEAPALTLGQPNTKPVPDPANALSVELAQMVAKGKISPAEALLLRRADSENEEESEVEVDVEADDIENDDEEDEAESDSRFDQEMDELLSAFADLRARSL